MNDLDPAAAPAAGTVLLVPTLAPAPAKAAAAGKRRRPPAAETAEAHDEAYETEPAAIAPEAAPRAGARIRTRRRPTPRRSSLRSPPRS